MPAARTNTGFPGRLERAMLDHPGCPKSIYGRYPWLAREIETAAGIVVTSETIRKWLIGATYPRKEKMAALAQVLAVDPAWLAYGSSSDDMTIPAEAMFFAGYLGLRGLSVAFPSEDEASAGYDLAAISRGQVLRFRLRVFDLDGETLIEREAGRSDARDKAGGKTWRQVGIAVRRSGIPQLFDLTEWQAGNLRMADGSLVGEDGRAYAPWGDPIR